jgi:transposase
LEAALGERIGVSDDEWALIGPLLPSERGRGCRPAGDNRPYFEGMVWMARTGAQWRHLPDEYGKWNSVFRRYRRWVVTGVFEAMLETLAAVVERDVSADMIDSTVVRAHHCAGLKKRDQEFEGLGRSRGGFTTKALLSLSKGCTPAVMVRGDRYVSS